MTPMYISFFHLCAFFLPVSQNSQIIPLKVRSLLSCLELDGAQGLRCCIDLPRLGLVHAARISRSAPPTTPRSAAFAEKVAAHWEKRTHACLLHVQTQGEAGNRGGLTHKENSAEIGRHIRAISALAKISRSRCVFTYTGSESAKKPSKS